MNDFSLRAIVDEIDMSWEESALFVNRRTGEVYAWHTFEDSVDDDDAEMAEFHSEIEESPDWIRLTDEFDLDEYRFLRSFARSRASENERASLLRAISGRGAFRLFRDEIYRLDIADEWHEYRRQALAAHAIERLEAFRIPFLNDLGEGA